MQTEVNRYQETCRMLKDYYVAMEGGEGTEKGMIYPYSTSFKFLMLYLH